MSDIHTVYEHQLIRVVTGAHPAMLAKVADPVGLACMARRLADAEGVAQLLVANGHGLPSQTLSEMVRALLKIDNKKSE
jgi:hypothetical protein